MPKLKKSKSCRVVNIQIEECDIYIGRGSKFGNPFRIGRDVTRKQVIEKYTKRLFVFQIFCKLAKQNYVERKLDASVSLLLVMETFLQRLLTARAFLYF